jgi:formylglycine-generating enzyme required for sulfatase activity
MAVLKLRWLALVGLAGCLPNVDYGGTEYRCDDGRSCPFCVTEVPPERPDAAIPPDMIDAGADASGLPIDPPMISVPASSFVQGCTPFVGEDNCPLDAAPSESISLSAYRIDQFEVSQGNYAFCVAAGICTEPSGDYDPTGTPTLPVVQVSYSQAATFCDWLGRRLPTESEWERAARGTDQRRYPWGADAPSCTLVQFDGCEGDLLPVGSVTGGNSPIGASDLAGNAAEWVADFYSPTYYPQGPNVDPPGPGSGSDRVVRGGSHRDDAEKLRTFQRERARPDETDGARGFRCAQ